MTFNLDRIHKKITYTANTSLVSLEETLKTECSKLAKERVIQAKQIARVELAIDMLKDKLEIETVEYRERLIDEL